MAGELRNIIAMGLGFLLIMGGYQPCQNFATSLLNLPCLPVGSISIGSIYAALAVSSVLAPVIIRKLGDRMAMIVTSLAYSTYVVSVSYIITPVVVLTSINIGLCGGVLNTASGSFLAKNCDDSNRGLYSGIFNAFNMGSAVPGNLLSIFVLTSDGPAPDPDSGSGSGHAYLGGNAGEHCGAGTTWRDRIVLGWNGTSSWFFILLAVMCAVGTLCLCFIRQTSIDASPGPINMDAVGDAAGNSTCKTIYRTLSLLNEPVMRPLLMLFLYSGFSQGYWSGVLTQQLPTSMIGAAMVVVGVAEVIGGLLYGILIDYWGVKPTMVVVLLQNCMALCISFISTRSLVGTDSSTQTMGNVLVYLACFLLGTADNGVWTCIYAVIEAKFENHVGENQKPSSQQLLLEELRNKSANNADDAFALLMCLNSVSVMVVFYVGPLLISNTTAPHCTTMAFFGQTLFVGGWELVSVLLFCMNG